jgi:hypothetical protein
MGMQLWPLAAMHGVSHSAFVSQNTWLALKHDANGATQSQTGVRMGRS